MWMHYKLNTKYLLWMKSYIVLYWIELFFVGSHLVPVVLSQCILWTDFLDNCTYTVIDSIYSPLLLFSQYRNQL